jgi:hypothetical protein
MRGNLRLPRLPAAGALVGAVLLLGLLWGNEGRTAAPATIALGDVSSEVVRKDVDLGALLRGSLAQELALVDLTSAAPRHVILSASLVRMDAEWSAERVTVTCVVSAMLLDEKRGTVFALLEGRARAENATVVPALERAAMEGAVRSAIARLPEAMK